MDQYLIVTISNIQYAFALSSVVEVLNEARIVPILGASKEVVGYAKVREEVMPLLNGNCLFAQDSQYGNLWVVLEKDGKKLAITVSSASDLIDANLEQVHGRQELFIRLNNEQKDIVCVIDTDSLFAQHYGGNSAQDASF